MVEIKNENYFVVNGWMLNELGLKGNELLVYAIIYGFCQNTNVCYASIGYIQQFTGASRPTVIKAIQELENKNLIKKVGISEKGTNIYLCNEINFTSKETLPQVVKKLYSPSKETLPNNIIYNSNNNINNTKEKEIKKNKSDQVKHKYGEYRNVLLTDNELLKLTEEVGNNNANAIIQFFSEMKEMKGYKYKSDYLAIKKWGIEAYKKNCPLIPETKENIKDYNSNPCPNCNQNKLYEEKTNYICDNCGAVLDYERALEYFRKLHKK